MPEQADNSRIRRPEAMASALIMGVALAWFLSGAAPLFGVRSFLMLLFPLAACFWVLDLPLIPRWRHLEVYVLLVLPLLFYGSLQYFLGTLRPEPWLWVVGPLAFPAYYLLLISLAALEKYKHLPQHVGRIVLNVLTLATGVLAYAFVFQADLQVWQGALFLLLFVTLLFLQGLIWWSNANLPYAAFYSVLAAWLMTMLYAVVSLWPTGYLVGAFVLTTGQYLLMGLIQNYFKKSLRRHVVLEYVMVSLIATMLVLSQVQWASTVF